LYAPATGIFYLQQLVKKYLRSVFKVSSPEYKQVSGLQFTKPR